MIKTIVDLDTPIPPARFSPYQDVLREANALEPLKAITLKFETREDATGYSKKLMINRKRKPEYKGVTIRLEGKTVTLYPPFD